MAKVDALIASNTEFDGILKFFGSILIDGYVNGKIYGEGILVVNMGGRVAADIHVTKVVNYGEITGNIFAEEKIEIYQSGKVFGAIQAPVIEIKKGGFFQGKSKTSKVDIDYEEAFETVEGHFKTLHHV